MKKLSITVYCSARDTIADHYINLAYDLGVAMAMQNFTLVYGGGGNGMMGAVARGCFNNGGEVIGVIPQFLLEYEGNDDSINTRCIITETMSERKRILGLHADGFIVMAGGVGTLEEFMEVLTWKTLKRHNLPIVLLDPNGYWQNFHELIAKMIELDFCSNMVLNQFVVCKTIAESLEYIEIQQKSQYFI